ncbi:GrpB family protein [Streptomyces sp. MP131-18]|uniref:GrpB family protein n=1 Tax=Streptomyces sp. MP131-18 TaxID=1857892 RepID=UPI0009D46C76|nr:GrpB family protein [Streptomyces sp. MP131-18]ONK15469.1 dephospho-CoA kinase/protein folding accessory domain-containing protein [Streptomyces sp. MP131-18]
MGEDRRRTPMTDAEIEAASVGEPSRVDGRVGIADYDPAWPTVYEREAALVGQRLNGLVRRLEHVGSTSVPGLPAKPVIDMLLLVPDPAGEAAYVPPLTAVGYRLAVREPEWYEHRVLRKQDPAPAAGAVNLHVLPEACAEAGRMLRFRDRLRAHAGDRELYAATKRHLAQREWTYMQHYADAKSEVVEAILARTGDGTP